MIAENGSHTMFLSMDSNCFSSLGTQYSPSQGNRRTGNLVATSVLDVACIDGRGNWSCVVIIGAKATARVAVVLDNCY